MNPAGVDMPTHQVNLEALIQREDFEIEGDTSDTTPTVFKAEELLKNRNYFKGLRKPDFQRETNNWSPEMILDFVKSYLDGDLIPALILWNSKKTGKVFVIDGCHRMSALIAYVNDDYGDGEMSRAFYSHSIPPQQAKLHKATHDLIDSQIGSYKRLSDVSDKPEIAKNHDELYRARQLFKRTPVIQEIDGPAAVAERSFLKINGNPAPIDNTELDVIKARAKPNAIATRALVRAGTGYQYWGRFTRADDIKKLAVENYNLLFGKVLEIDQQAADIPRAGQPYSKQAFEMMLDIVNLFNNITPTMWKQSERPKTPKPNTPLMLADDDEHGTKTIELLEQVKRVGMLAVGGAEFSTSLGLDPAVYCYGATGKFHSGAYLACLKFAQELKHKNWMGEFTKVRRDFEEFIVNHKYFINQLGHGKGSRTRPLEALVSLHRTVFLTLKDGTVDDTAIVERILQQPGLEKLKIETPKPMVTKRKKFTKKVTQAGVVQQILETRARCTECRARLAPPFRSKDHDNRIEDGGKGNLGNLNFTHPYCQSGPKEKRAHEAKQGQLGI
jgi:hypothetical protein